MNPARSLFLSLALLASNAHAAKWTDYFAIEKITNPAGIDPQVGAIEALADGKIAVAFHRGEVMIYDPAAKSWSLFASGLQEPLGMLSEPNGNLLVMQRAELTRLVDSDKDGKADHYETVFDGFGMSGNYHEFSYGPVRDQDGSLFIVLGLASNGARIRPEIRGTFSDIGLSRELLTNSKDWKNDGIKAGRMYSRVPYRGWVIKLSADGKTSEPWASGFRSPNGIGFDAKGRLLITDNQGDWRPTSPLYEIKKDGFYGNPASLVWTKNWDGRNPLEVPVAELDKLQVPAAGYFPQGELANSPTQPIIIPPGAFPKSFDQNTLIGEMNQPTLVRVLDDEVDGTFQTALVPFLDKSPLGIGNHRLAFGKDGAFYVGKTALSWAGGSGITRIKWNGKPFFSLDQIKARPAGFTLKFSQPVDPASIPAIVLHRHTYQYHANYGSPKVDDTVLPVTSAILAPDGLSLTLETAGPLKEKYLHFFDLTRLRSKSGDSLLGDKAWYEVVKAPK
jgi:glucose/arabinose dehydrogenase